MSSPAINKLVLGTVQFGLQYGINNQSGKPGREQVARILDTAWARGIRLLDTAEAYGDAQEVIGDYHHSSPNRFGVITKFGAGRGDLSSSLEERVEQDLETLRVSLLYSYMFHSFKDYDTCFARYEPALIRLKESGKIAKLGVSVYTNPEFEQVLDREEVDLVQLPFNLLDNQSQRAALITQAKQKGIEVHTRSAFLQGLFFKAPAGLPEKLQPLQGCLEEIRSLAERHGMSVADMALNYALQQPEIDRVLIGVDSEAQLDQNLASLHHQLPAGLLGQIDRLHVKDTALLNPVNWNA